MSPSIKSFMMVNIMATFLMIVVHFEVVQSQALPMNMAVQPNRVFPNLPGVALRTTRKGFDYALELALNYLKDRLIPDSIPDFSCGSKCKVYGVKLTKMRLPKVTYQFIEPNKIRLIAKDGYIEAFGRAKAKKLIWLKTKYTIKVRNFGVDVSTVWTKTARGTPEMSIESCKSFGDGKIKFKGGLGWLLNLILKRKVSKKITAALSKKVCPEIEKYPIKANEFLGEMKTSLKIRKNLKISYKMVRNPEIKSQYVQLMLSGKTNGGKAFAPRMQYSNDFKSKMVQIYLSDFVLNSFSNAAFNGGLMKFNEKAKWFKNLQTKFRTTCASLEFCLGTLVPEIRQNFGDYKTNLDMQLARGPHSVFKKQKSLIYAQANVKIKLIPPVKTKKNVEISFLLSTDGSISKLKVDSNNVLTAKVKIEGVQLSNFEIKNPYPDVSLSGLEAKMKLALAFVKPLAQPLLDELLEDGFPVPQIEKLKLKNPKIQFLDRTLMIGSDLRF